jgi:hypothetical protein
MSLDLGVSATFSRLEWAAGVSCAPLGALTANGPHLVTQTRRLRDTSIVRFIFSFGISEHINEGMLTS